MAVKGVRVYPGCKAMKAALKAPDRWTYSHLGISPPKTDEFENPLDLFHATAGGEGALNRKYHDDAIRAHTSGAGEPPIQSAQGEMLIEAAE